MDKPTQIFLGVGLSLALLIGYSTVGTSGNVDEIKRIAPAAIEDRNWEIMRTEGWQYGSWAQHGGRVWYHVKNADNPNIQYRVQVTLWGDELQFYYGEPEKLSRVDLDIAN